MAPIWRASSCAVRSLQRPIRSRRDFWAGCLWPSESRFPDAETVVSRDAARMSLLCNQTQHLTLTRPFDGEVAESGHAHSVRESPIDRCLDEVGRKERERDCHVDLPRRAALTFGDAFGIRSGIGNEFVEPAAPPRN